MTIEMPDLFVHCIKFILSGAIGAAIIVIINHFYKRYEYNCSLKNDIYALLCNFFFIASIQSSELANHKMQLVEKLKKLKSLDASSLAQDITFILQDIIFDKDIIIKSKDLSTALFKLRGMNDFQTGDPSMLQSFYLVNKKYLEIIVRFIRFNEMKRATQNIDNHTNIMLEHFNKYMPDILTLTDDRLVFTNQTFNSCDDLLEKLGGRKLKNWFKHKPRPYPTALGSVVQLM